MTTELLEDMQPADEPGTWRAKTIIASGPDEEDPSLVALALKSAGWVYVYDTETRERSTVNRNNLPTVMAKRRPDGSRIFTTHQPDSPPTRGTLCCWLHPSNPAREDYDALGLPVCPKSNLTSAYQVLRHMQSRHKTEYATIVEEKRLIEEVERKEDSRRLLEALLRRE